MIAYNQQYLDNLAIHTEAKEALDKKIITAETYERIRQAYPYKLYTPNAFIRFGLFLLTVLAAACGLGLLFLMGLTGSERGMAGVLIFYGVFVYAGLELFIYKKGVFQSGVDDALLYIAGALVLAGIGLRLEIVSGRSLSLLALAFSLAGAIRYADRLMALTAYTALLCSLFYAHVLHSFVLMAVSVVFYFLFTRLRTLQHLRHYHGSLVLLRAATLLSFYLAGNYFFIREWLRPLPGLHGPGWLWWTLTAITPVAYIARGIRKKDLVFLWTGLGLVAASVLTVRYYYHLLPAESAMIITGCILIAGSWFLIRYLRTVRNGFSSEKQADVSLLEHLPVEGLIIAESFRTIAQPTDPGVRFGGGSGGGGGAGGDF